MTKIVIAGQGIVAVSALNFCGTLMSFDEISVIPSPRSLDERQPDLAKEAAKYEIGATRLEEAQEMRDIVFLSLGFHEILRPASFASSRLYNLHFSLLPAYRGLYPSVFPILRKETTCGVSLHKIDSGIDTGPVVSQRAFQIRPNETSYSLNWRSGIEASLLLFEVFPDLLDDKVQLLNQDSTQATYFGKDSIDFNNAEVIFNNKAEDIASFIRGFFFPSFQTALLGGRRVIESVVTDSLSQQPPGTKISETGEWAKYSTLDYDIAVRLNH